MTSLNESVELAVVYTESEIFIDFLSEQHWREVDCLAESDKTFKEILIEVFLNLLKLIEWHIIHLTLWEREHSVNLRAVEDFQILLILWRQLLMYLLKMFRGVHFEAYFLWITLLIQHQLSINVFHWHDEYMYSLLMSQHSVWSCSHTADRECIIISNQRRSRQNFKCCLNSSERCSESKRHRQRSKLLRKRWIFYFCLLCWQREEILSKDKRVILHIQKNLISVHSWFSQNNVMLS